MTGPWIQTGAGAALDLLEPDPAALDLRDLVRALSYLNRYTGHARDYNVAQHSVLVCLALREEGQPEDVQRAGLLHDLHEAVIGDVSSPVKRAIRQIHREAWAERYREQGYHASPATITEPDPFSVLEDRWARAVASRFGFQYPLQPAVKVMDLRLLMAEARDLLLPPPRSWGIDVEPWSWPIQKWTPGLSRVHFLAQARRLGVLP